jgi:periplasmic protein TonB
MTTSYPIAATPERMDGRSKLAAVQAPPVGAWRYKSARLSRGALAIAALASAGVHAAIFFGFGHAAKKPAISAPPVAVIRLTIPDIKDLEEPEQHTTDAPTEARDLATLVPMQADLPQLPQPSDFVQAINFSSLVETPEFSRIAINVIPETFRGGRQLAEKIGKIFDLTDLDRIPDPLVQRAPAYPIAMRREGASGTVHVQFVVDVAGQVLDAHVIATTNHGFDEAAVNAVAKWKFRPGIKSGRKVNTNMAVPIVFSLAEIID